MMKQIQELKVGTIVKLKSGGPDMAIKGAVSTNGNIVRCQWFAGKKLESGDFPTDSLELVKLEPKGE